MSLNLTPERQLLMEPKNMSEEKVFSGGARILSCSLGERTKQQETWQGGRTGWIMSKFVTKTNWMCHII